MQAQVLASSEYTRHAYSSFVVGSDVKYRDSLIDEKYREKFGSSRSSIDRAVARKVKGYGYGCVFRLSKIPLILNQRS
jgi:hypothetical protein